MKIGIENLKKLRAETQAGVSDCRQALEDAGGDYVRARKLLTDRGLEKAGKKEGKATNEGIVEVYAHATGKVASMVTLLCETDFVARNDEFRKLGRELAMQVAAMDPDNVAELLKSPYIRDASITIADLIKKTIIKVGENITVGEISRQSIKV
jgi:elongation factor Ts